MLTHSMNCRRVQVQGVDALFIQELPPFAILALALLTVKLKVKLDFVSQ